jgi:hypothetical protein
VSGIAIYVEGGGDGKEQKAELREGFNGFLSTLKEAARFRRIRWKLVCCGGRNQAYDAFRHAARTEPEQLNVLLVDSEDGVGTDVSAPARRQHLTRREGWDLSAIGAGALHLMTRCMETWIVADAEALKEFYGQGFNANALPRRENLEDETKVDVLRALENATRNTKTKGPYAKIRHASHLLQRVDPGKAKTRCACCRALFDELSTAIELHFAGTMASGQR